MQSLSSCVKGYPSLSPTQLPKEQVGFISQQLGIMSRVQWKSLQYILNLHLRGLWGQVAQISDPHTSKAEAGGLRVSSKLS